MTYSQILDVINQNIKQNGNEEITGVILNSVLRALLGFVNDGFITINDVIQILADTKSVNIVGSIGLTTDTTNLPAGVYNTQTSGKYTNASGIVVKDGYYTLLRKDNGVWKLESEVEMPMQDLTPFNNRITKAENKVNDFIRDFAVEVDQKFNRDSENAQSGKAIYEEYKVLDDMFVKQKDVTTFIGAINGQYLKSDGSLVGGTSLFTSPYYEGVPGEVFKANFGNTHLVFYKEDKSIHSIVKGATDWHNSHYEHIITIPEGAKYFRYSFYQDSPVVAYCYKLETSIKSEFLEEPIHQIFSNEGSEEFEYGFYTGNKTAVATSGFGFLQKNFKINADSKIISLKCNVTLTGKVKLWILRLNKWGVTYNPNRTIDIDVVAGNNTIAVNIDVFKDEIIGLTAVGSNSLKFSEKGGGLGAFFSTGFGGITQDSLSSQGVPYAGDFSFVIAGVDGGLIWKVNQIIGNPNQKEVDKSLLIIGDSNSDVQHQKWVTEFVQNIKFKRGYKNVALSGARLGFSGLLKGQNITRATGYGQVLEAIKDTSFTPDVVLIFLGVNDNSSIIDMNSFDTIYDKSINYINEATTNIDNVIFNSMTGAFRLTVDKLQTVYPDCEVVVITPAGLSNTKTSDKIAKALIELSWRSGCKLIDLYGRCGINQMLEPKYTDGLHYTHVGAKYIGKTIAKELYKLIN